jgi:cellobiose phosphorylase
MMELHRITARFSSISPDQKVQEVYPDCVLADAALFEMKSQIYLGFTGLKKAAPILALLDQDPAFEAYIQEHASEQAVFLFSKEEAYKNGEPLALTPEVKKAIRHALRSVKAYGGVLNPDGSHTIDLLAPSVGPHYGVNLLLGWREGFADPLLTTPKSVVDGLGRGSFRAKAAYQVLATRWDIRPEENGNPFNRQFYLLENGKQIFYSADLTHNVKTATCTHFPNKSEIVYRLKDGLQVKRTIALLEQKPGLPDAVEVQNVTLISPVARNLQIVFTGTFGFSNPGCQEVDVIYQTVIHQSEILLNDQGELMALSPNYYPCYFSPRPRFVSLHSSKGYADSFSNDATSFIGGGSIEHPEGVGHLNNAMQMKGASFFALGQSFALAPNVPFDLTTFTGMMDGSLLPLEQVEPELAKEVADLLTKFPDGASVEKQLQKQDQDFADYASYFSLQSGNPLTDAMMNTNIPFQTRYQSFVSRAFAQTQKGYREIGFREIQDLYASIPYLVAAKKKDLAESLLSSWISNVYAFGYANHNFFEVGKEPGMCSDDSLWLLPAVRSYVEATGDLDFLNQSFPMAGGGNRVLKDTLKAILVYSGRISVGKHGLPLLDKADWNDCLKIDTDCLDGPSKEKRYYEQLERNHQSFGVPFESELSESVMNAFLLVYALNEAIALMKESHDSESVSFYEQLKADEIKAITSSSYIDGYYARVLINRAAPKNGITYVGAPGDGLSSNPNLQNGSLYLNSFSWSLLSGVADEAQIASMLDLADRFLRTPSGYQLCSAEDLTLTGAKEAATSHYFPGDRENGGVFKHATMMFTRALLLAAKRPYSPSLKKKMVDDAYFMLHLVYPYHCWSNPYRYKGNPRFCTQYNNPLTEENIGPILSGTATWLTLSFFEAMGLSQDQGELTLQPILEKGQGDLSYHYHFSESDYQVILHKKKNHYSFKVMNLTLDGVSRDPNDPLPLLHDQKTHVIEATLD